MPIYEITCADCRYEGEVLALSSAVQPTCPQCGSQNTEKKMSATSSLTGRTGQSLPGAGDSTCCGSSPGTGSCAGPGSCCGRQGL
jgi:putative FmdB family regulatory protein